MTHKAITYDEINSKTELNKFWERDIIKLADKVEKDPDHDIRIKGCQCKKCFYVSTLSGQAFTEYNCRNCERSEMHSNTDVPLLCLRCAKQLKVCCYCISDLKGVIRRNKPKS